MIHLLLTLIKFQHKHNYKLHLWTIWDVPGFLWLFFISFDHCFVCISTTDGFILWSRCCQYFYDWWFFLLVTIMSVFLQLMFFFYSGHGIVCISTTGSFISGHDITCISTTDGFVFWLRYCQYFLDWCFFLLPFSSFVTEQLLVSQYHFWCFVSHQKYWTLFHQCFCTNKVFLYNQ